MAPILPGISDRPEQLDEVVREARAAGATAIWSNVLFLRAGTREHFLESLAREWPELVPEYERLYARSAYLGKDEAGPVRELVGELRRKHGVRDRRAAPLVPPPEPEQLSFAV
jgi:DNA repair photolyase